MAEPIWALGLMSGTSLDGVDAALIRTDGTGVAAFGPALTLAYGSGLRERLRAVLGRDRPSAATAEVEREVTDHHATAVERLISENNISPSSIGIIGFHGHTVLHRPEAGRTWQIGDGLRLARRCGIPVVCDFRSADVAAGGQGAPLAPLYHMALARTLPRPLAVLNIGGVANVTWIGDRVSEDGDGAVIAFDTGPGNALLDDWVRRHTGEAMDRGGALAARGRVDETALARLLDDPYFRRSPPKSLDRNDFSLGPVEKLSATDGAATLTALTVAAVVRAEPHFPAPVVRWLVCGGGRRNPVMMAELRDALEAVVEPVEGVGWRGDYLEAEAFAFLAVRSLRRLPLSLPGTTGVAQPTTGGVLHRPDGVPVRSGGW